MVNKKIRSGQTKIDNYIEDLEAFIELYSRDNATKILLETNKALGVLADDIAAISKGEPIAESSILNDNKQNAVFERIMKIIEASDKISKLSDKVKTIFNIVDEDDKIMNIESFVKQKKA